MVDNRVTIPLATGLWKAFLVVIKWVTFLSTCFESLPPFASTHCLTFSALVPKSPARHMLTLPKGLPILSQFEWVYVMLCLGNMRWGTVDKIHDTKVLFPSV